MCMSYHSCSRKIGMTTARVTTIKISTATRTVTKQHKPRLSLKPLAGLCAAWSIFGGKGLKNITLYFLWIWWICFAWKYFHREPSVNIKWCVLLPPSIWWDWNYRMKTSVFTEMTRLKVYVTIGPIQWLKGYDVIRLYDWCTSAPAFSFFLLEIEKDSNSQLKLTWNLDRFHKELW